jgi:hypothetical protein
MYFITEEDPNYTIKGSRDPMGFQVIWQHEAKKLIPYLSTVSASVKDFQILCIAYALKNKLEINDKEFEVFFIRLEQLFAYTRFKMDKEEGFNGIDKVRKKMDEANKEIRISYKDGQILSNQRAYGIWGKYIRPFTDLHMATGPDFEKIYTEKINANPSFLNLAISFKKKSIDDSSNVSLEKLESFYSLLEKPSRTEMEFLVPKLLQDMFNNEMLAIFSTNGKLKELPFYSLIDELIAASKNERFNKALNSIKNTEKILSPLNRIFRYLQTKSVWTYDEIQNDSFITKCKSVNLLPAFGVELNPLANLLAMNNIDLVKGIVARNQEVCDRRKSTHWMSITESGIEVNHFDGAYYLKDYDPNLNNDNTYFFSSFISLHNQLN